MERFEIIKEVGSGTFGRVFQAVMKETGQVFAIKKLNHKYYSEDECLNLRELKSMRVMNHPNVMKLKAWISYGDVYFVFEYMDFNLYQLMESRGPRAPFTEDQIRDLSFQMFLGIEHIHQRGYFHRDIKPDNILLSRDLKVKIADFGTAREIDSQPPLTRFVGTLWYRAPEQLLGSTTYGSAVDMWAMGTILVELFMRRPLFPGSRTGQQLDMISSIIGGLTKADWPEGNDLARKSKYQFPDYPAVGCLAKLLPPAGFISQDAIQLIHSLLSWDPSKRPTASKVLRHPFFQKSSYVQRLAASVELRNHNHCIEPKPFVRHQLPGRIRMN